MTKELPHYLSGPTNPNDGIGLSPHEEQVLDVADWGDVARLHGIEAGVPVVLSPNQKSTIDGLVGKLGSDALAKRVQGACSDAFRTGKVAVH